MKTISMEFAEYENELKEIRLSGYESGEIATLKKISSLLDAPAACDGSEIWGVAAHEWRFLKKVIEKINKLKSQEKFLEQLKFVQIHTNKHI